MSLPMSYSKMQLKNDTWLLQAACLGKSIQLKLKCYLVKVMVLVAAFAIQTFTLKASYTWTSFPKVKLLTQWLGEPSTEIKDYLTKRPNI